LLALRKAIGADWRRTLNDCAAQMPVFVKKIAEISARLAAPPVYGDRELEGAGTGLAIAQRIVQRHGGSIAVDGKIGSGTVFRFTLPAGLQDVAQ
jgi:signal transduction histidine kinase